MAENPKSHERSAGPLRQKSERAEHQLRLVQLVMVESANVGEREGVSIVWSAVEAPFINAIVDDSTGAPDWRVLCTVGFQRPVTREEDFFGVPERSCL